MTVDWKKKLLPNLPYLLFVYLFDKLCQAVRLAPGLDASEKFRHLSQGFTEAFSSVAPSLHLWNCKALAVFIVKMSGVFFCSLKGRCDECI